MRRVIKWLIGVVVAVVLLAAGFIGWYVFGSRVPDKPKLSATPNTGGGPSTPDGPWHVVRSDDVYVGYRIKEVFGDALLRREAVGHSDAVNGSLTIADDQVTAVVVSADLDQLGSDRAARDAYLRDNTLETSKFPTARFTLTEPIALPAGAGKAKKLHALRASGRLLLHGVTHPITFTLDARWNGPTIDVVGTTPINLRSFGIEPPHTVIASVDDTGSVELGLTFAPGK